MLARTVANAGRRHLRSGSRQGCIMTSLRTVTKKPRSASPTGLDEFALFFFYTDIVIELI